MFLTVLILSSILKDFQADAGINNSYPVGQEINQKFGLQMSPNSCAGMTVETCEKYRPQELQQCKICGLINGNPIGAIPLIIGGDFVDPPYKYPWMVKINVSLNDGKFGLCGGVIISANYILTAAHCVKKDKDRPSSFLLPHEVRILFLTKTYAVTPGAKVEKIIAHPKHDLTRGKHDIALIKLEENINCGTYSNPICLPPANFYPEENTHFRYTGWGDTSQDKGAGLSEKLKEGMGRLVNYSECLKYHVPNNENNDYCLMSVRNQQPCSGDSGGPMFFSQNGISYTMGVFSYTPSPKYDETGKKCRSGEPFGFASVPRVVQWISKITGLSPSE